MQLQLRVLDPSSLWLQLLTHGRGGDVELGLGSEASSAQTTLYQSVSVFGGSGKALS